MWQPFRIAPDFHYFSTMRPVATRAILVVALAVGYVAGTPAPSAPATFTIKAAGEPGSWRWDPNFVKFKKGNRVVWKNPTNITHVVKAYKGPWSKDTSIPPGEQTSKRFRKAGRYKFRCTVGSGTAAAHSSLQDGQCSGMCGTIRVTRD